MYVLISFYSHHIELPQALLFLYFIQIFIYGSVCPLHIYHFQVRAILTFFIQFF